MKALTIVNTVILFIAILIGTACLASLNSDLTNCEHDIGVLARHIDRAEDVINNNADVSIRNTKMLNALVDAMTGKEAPSKPGL